MPSLWRGTEGAASGGRCCCLFRSSLFFEQYVKPDKRVQSVLAGRAELGHKVAVFAWRAGSIQARMRWLHGLRLRLCRACRQHLFGMPG